MAPTDGSVSGPLAELPLREIFGAETEDDDALGLRALSAFADNLEARQGSRWTTSNVRSPNAGWISTTLGAYDEGSDWVEIDISVRSWRTESSRQPSATQRLWALWLSLEVPCSGARGHPGPGRLSAGIAARRRLHVLERYTGADSGGDAFGLLAGERRWLHQQAGERWQGVVEADQASDHAVGAAERAGGKRCKRVVDHQQAGGGQGGVIQPMELGIVEADAAEGGGEAHRRAPTSEVVVGVPGEHLGALVEVDRSRDEEEVEL